MGRENIEGGRAVGVRTADGTELRARIVAANVGPKLLYERLVDPADLPDDFRRRVAGFKVGSGTFRMNVALAYRAPIAGLYMCGAGTHPGGGVSGAPGHNAAREILRDRRWWRRGRRR